MSVLGAATCLLCWPDYTKLQLVPRTDGVIQTITPVLSGGSWLTTMPLSNLVKDQYYYGARSTDATTGSTVIIINYGTPRPARVFALIRHNLSSLTSGGATVRVTHGNDASFATFAYQSAFNPVFTATSAPGTLPTGWIGGPNTEALLPYASLTYVQDAGQNFSGQYTRFEISDTANGNGYVQVGGLFVGPGWQPAINAAYGAKFSMEDTSTSVQGDTGVEFWTKRRIRRIVDLQFEMIRTDQALELPFELQMRVGLSDRLLFVMDPSSPYHMHRLSFPARQRTLSALEYPYSDRFTAPIQLREAM